MLFEMDVVNIFNNINEIGWGIVVIAAILLLSLWIAMKELAKKALSSLGLRTNASIEKEKLMTRLNDMQEEINTFKSNRIHDREQSLEIQKQLTEKQVKISETLDRIGDKVDLLSKEINDMQEKNDSKDRAKLKDRIAQSYRYYHKEQKWTSMDKESFNDLIRSYEASGGKNSFVHSTCEPESETWEIIDE